MLFASKNTWNFFEAPRLNLGALSNARGRGRTPVGDPEGRFTIGDPEGRFGYTAFSINLNAI
jgi:hypothetical protein